MSKPTLLVLAAGMGSRYGGLKQVEPVGPSGELLLEYSLYDALRAGFGQLVVVIRRDIEKAFRERIGSRLEGRIPVRYVYQELDNLPPGFQPPAGRTKPWGTGHAVLVAREEIAEPFAAINADDFYGPEAYKLIAQALRQSRPDRLAMVGFVLRNTLSDHGTVSRGVCRCSPEGFLESIEEHPRVERAGRSARSLAENGKVTQQLSGDETVSMNMWGFPSSFFDELQSQFREFLEERGQEQKSEFYIPTAVDRFLHQGKGRVEVFQSRENWFGVTYPEDKPQVVQGIHQKIEQGVYPSSLWD